MRTSRKKCIICAGVVCRPMRAHNSLCLRTLLFALMICIHGCQQNHSTGTIKSSKPDRETSKMVQLLKQVNLEHSTMENPYANSARVAYFAAQADSARNEQKLYAKFYQGVELVRAGKTMEGIEAYRQVFSQLEFYNYPMPISELLHIRKFEAIAYMRQGEQENCLLNHNPESCLFPIRESGIHQLQEGSSAAIKIYLNSLKIEPENLDNVWLLNLAYMTLGKYPGEVPQKYLIPPEAFDSDYQIPRFPDIASHLNLDKLGLCGGSIAEDFNNDGLIDILASSWNLEHNLSIFYNRGAQGFEEVTPDAGIEGITGGLNLTSADYDNDGDVDIFVLRGAWLSFGHFPNSLLRNNGDGTFSDVTQSSGVLSFHPTQTACWADFNNDGWLDLFIGNESYGQSVHPCELYLNNKNGTFTESARPAGLDFTGFVKGVASADMNNDSWPDLYVSIMDGPNRLYQNLGLVEDSIPRFVDIATQAGVLNPVQSFPTWFFDYNNDGWEDIFVSGYSMKQYNHFAGETAAEFLGLPWKGEAPCLYKNNGDGTFSNMSKDAGLHKPLYAMGCNYGDLDNDGWLDFYLGTGEPDFQAIVPNRMFRNHMGQKFQDVTSAGGFGHLQKGHGVSFADLDNDGDQDIYAVIGGAYEGDGYNNVLFENPGNGKHWIKLNLRGIQSNRFGIGARIQVVLRTSDGERSIFRTVSTGGSFGVSPHRQEIGLGNGDEILKLSIFWPVSGIEQSFENIGMNRNYQVTEGVNDLIELDLPSIKYDSLSDPGHRHHTQH